MKEFDKDSLQLLINKLERRVTCRSSERVKTSLFFHVIFSILDQMSNRSEEGIESELNERNGIAFSGFYSPYKVTVKIEYQNMDDLNGNSTTSSDA